MNKVAYFRAGIYGFFGLMALAIDQYMNIEFLLGIEKGITSLVIAVPACGLLSTIAWPTGWRCVLRGDIANGGLLMGVFVCVALFSLGASIHRAGEAYDGTLADKKAAHREWIDANRDHTAKDAALQAEILNKGCGSVCKAKEAEVQKALTRKEKAKAQAEATGVDISSDAEKSVDPMAKRIAAILPISEHWIQTFYPLCLPIGIWMASIGFIGAAVGEFSSVKAEPRIGVDVPVWIKIADYVHTEQARTGRKPTINQVANRFDMKRSTAYRHMKASN